MNVNNKKMSKKIVFITQTALLSTLAIILSMLEALLPPLPIPIPGGKLGLSNVVTFFTIQNLGVKSTLIVVLFKAIFAGLTRGGIAFVMSLCAGVLSALVMYCFLISKGNYFGYIGIAVFSAVCHNTVQISIAALLTDSSVFFYFPVLLILSVIAGCLTGTAMGIIMPVFRKINLKRQIDYS